MRLFKLEIAPDKRMIPVALTATAAAARYFFKDECTVEHITLALEEAVANVTEFCLSDSLESICIEAELDNNEAFVVSVTDKGLPGELDKILKGEDGLGLSLMSGMVDHISIENLGTGGRCQRLIKYLSDKPGFELRKHVEGAADEPVERLTIRPLQEDEAVEVSRCIYDEFAFTYVNDMVYYPERFNASIKRGDTYSLVAVTDDGEVAAHLAIWKWGILPGIWEMGMGVVKRRFRSAHIMGKLTHTILEYARDTLELSCLLCEPVLYHPYTQKISVKQGFQACGAGLCYTPLGFANTISNSPDKRNNVAMAMNVFKKEKRTLYLPDELIPMIQEILGRMELPAMITDDRGQNAREKCESICESYPSIQLARIVVYHSGKDIAEQLHNSTVSLKRNGMQVIELFLPAGEPGAAEAYKAAKRLGYFCTGFLPLSGRGDMIIMENLMAQAVDYKALQTVEPFTSLLERIREMDPNETEQKGGIQ